MSDYTPEIPYGYCHCGCGGKTKPHSSTSALKGHKKGEPRKFLNGHQRRIFDRAKNFWGRVRLTANDDLCWEWTGCRNKAGYGTILSDYKHTLTHRMAWELTNGKIPEGLYALHHCDNKGCCNPKHLYLGTYADNSRDLELRGSRGHQKLKREQIPTIRERYKNGATLTELAKNYGVALRTISRAVKRISWKHTE